MSDYWQRVEVHGSLEMWDDEILEEINPKLLEYVEKVRRDENI